MQEPLFKADMAPSAKYGGWWLRILPRFTRVGEPGVGTVAMFFFGWGFDDQSPLRPWPRVEIERRRYAKSPGAFIWATWFGFLVGLQVAIPQDGVIPQDDGSHQ